LSALIFLFGGAALAQDPVLPPLGPETPPERVASEGEPTAVREPDAADPCRLFASDARGTALLRLARRLFRAAAEAVEMYPVDPPSGTGRPAGPRDEPPPPEWPAGPVGLLLCLNVDGKIRACEGDVVAMSTDMGAALIDLAEKLPRSRSRGRPPKLNAPQRDGATLEAAFLLEPAPPEAAPDPNTPNPNTPDSNALDPSTTNPNALYSSTTSPKTPDPQTMTLRLTGAGGALVLLPGEAKTLRKAARVARKAGVAGRGRNAAAIQIVTRIPIGSIPLKIN